MTDDSWEHCLLEKNDLAKRGADGKPEGEPKVQLTYYGAQTFTDSVKPEAWDRAIAQLGREGWEMVSATDTLTQLDGAYVLVEKVFFKRRMGKPVYQPMLSNM